MNDNLLIENAILAFLHHYPQHEWVDDYKVLLNKVQTLRSQSNEQPENTTVQKRGRPAKRQRTQKASSSKVSKEKSEDVKTKTTT